MTVSSRTGIASRSRKGLSYAGVSVVARTVGLRDCLQAVCSECGLIGNDCGLAGSCVCAERELKPALVCKLACDCLQAATDRPRGGGDTAAGALGAER